MLLRGSCGRFVRNDVKFWRRKREGDLERELRSRLDLEE
jgi:hypothetical protein